MCIQCLKLILKEIDTNDTFITSSNHTLDCPCCIKHTTFLRSVNNDLKVLCLTKMKKNSQACLHGLSHLTRFDETLKCKIKHKLQIYLEELDDNKQELSEIHYLNEMNNLKVLNDCLNNLEKADHR